jgi:single-strand DNA-binding protein
MNVWNFTGNLGKDSEVKFLPSGEAICTFSVAVSSGYGDKKKTTWANCALFGKQAASSLPSYLTQGTSVAVSGELTLDEWKGQDGTTQKSIKVNVLKIDLLGSSQGKNAPAAQGAAAHQNNAARQQPQQQAPAGFDDPAVFDDIPF